jgi:predicted membrane-bound spermidine synthase
VLILLPLRWLPARGPQTVPRAPTFIYFAALGLAYMFLEMALISRFTRFLGDPIYAAAVVLAAFMIFSGLGSLLSRRCPFAPSRTIALAVAAIAILGLAYLLGMDRLFAAAAAAGQIPRVILSLALLAPLALAMGVPFPHALTQLHRHAPHLVPWAWGVNGFCSVLATSLAVLLATSVGFRPVLLAAVLAYVLAAAVAPALTAPRRPRLFPL